MVKQFCCLWCEHFGKDETHDHDKNFGISKLASFNAS